MKVKLKSVLKTTHCDFDCFQENQIILRSGNALCIREIGKSQSQFINLVKGLDHLYFFKPAPNKKAIFTAERLSSQIQIASYTIKGERKAINLSQTNPFFNKDNIASIELLVDQFDSSIVYAAVHGKNDSACILLLQFQKMKIMSLGFLSDFQDIKVNTRQSMTLSVCGMSGVNYVKTLKSTASNSQWEIQQKLYKKIQKDALIRHQILSGGRLILATKSEIYVYDDNEQLQSIGMQPNQAISILLKIPKGLLVATSSNKVKLYIEQSDQITLSYAGEISIDLAEQRSIYHIVLTSNNQEVIARSTNNELFVWKCDEIDIQSQNTPKNHQFSKIQSIMPTESHGNISISTDKKICLFAGENIVTLWNIQKNRTMLSTSFSGGQHKRAIYACAISPDGNSFLAAFQDRVRIYKILLTKFKYANQFTIKRCKNIIFSHGGQLAACLYGKGNNSSIAILNILRMAEVGILKTQAEPTQMLWNQLDDDFAVTTQNNYVQAYKVNDCSKLFQIKIASKINLARYDYSTKKMLVSTDKGIQIIANGSIIQSIPINLPNFNYIFSLHGYYIAACKDGMLYWSSNIKFEYFNELPVFTNQPYNLLCRNGYLLAYSSYQNVIAIQYERTDFISKKTNVNEQIVLIERDQVNNLFEKVKNLQNNFQILTVNTQVKLQEERKMYEDQIAKKTKQFQEQIAFCNRKFSDITIEKIKQEKQTQKVFDQLQTGQVKSVNQLQKMYDTRLRIQKQKLMTLQQNILEQKLKYDKVILQLQAKYHREVGMIRDEYSKKIREQSKKIDEVKKIGLDYKTKMEMKLIDVQEQNEVTLFDMQKTKDDIITNLNQKIVRLEEELDKSLINYHNLKQQFQEAQFQRDRQKNEINRLNTKLKESINRIQSLEGEANKKNGMLKEKDQLIEQQAHQIGGLEKAKYVLSFRTTEIRKQLEPKDSLIDKLKSELFKLDEEFKGQQKKSYQLGRKLEKYQKINEIQKKQNGQLKVSYRNKERTHDQLCSQLFMMVNTMDQKEWSGQIIRLYQTYIKQDKFKSHQKGKKKDDTVDEINRHLIHVQQSLMQVSSGNDKLIKGKQKDVIRKMKENSQLVFDLNVMRKKQNEYLTEIKEKANEISRLKRELTEYTKPSTRANTANTGLTRRVVASRDFFSNDRSMLDIADPAQQLKRQSQARQKHKERSRIASAHKTLMWREDKRQKSGKLFDLARQLQAARGTIKRQDRMIQQLNQRLLGQFQQQPN